MQQLCDAKNVGVDATLLGSLGIKVMLQLLSGVIGIVFVFQE